MTALSEQRRTVAPGDRTDGAARAIALGAAGVAIVAAVGTIALRDFQPDRAPSPLLAGAFAGTLSALVAWTASRRAGALGRRVALAASFLAVMGWILQSRAPVSDAATASTGPSSQGIGETPVWLGLGVVLFLLAVRFGRVVIRSRWIGGPLGALLVVGLSIAPLVPGLGLSQGGVNSWISVAGISAQPGEFARVLLVLFIAGHLDEWTPTLSIPGQARGARTLGLGSFADLARVFGVVAAALVLLLVQDDLGPAILVVLVVGSMTWVSTGRLVYPAAAVLGFVGGALALMPFSAKVSDRVDRWLDPFGDQGLAVVNGVALQAQARGGLTGVGLGATTDPYWVAARNDYILPQAALRFGLIGVGVIAGVFVVLVRSILQLAARSDDRGRLVVAGAGAAIAFQALLIAAGSTSAFVLTGVALPFLSYGGSSVMATFLLLGLAIAATPEPDGAQPPVTAASRRPIVLGIVLAAVALLVLSKSVATATIDASAVSAERGNPWRVAQVSLDRGKILAADGTVLARSVRVDDEWHREYPLGPAAAGVVGWVSRNGSMGGAELAFHERLDDGEDVRLTIDAPTQRAAAAALDGRTGAVVVMDPRSGAVLAMASTPTFDPELLADPDMKAAAAARARLDADPAKPLLSRAAGERFAPGSIFKLVTANAGVEAGFGDVRYPVLRSWSPTGDPVANADGMACGGDLAQMLEVSCNTTAMQAAVDAGPAAMRRSAEQLGALATSDLDLGPQAEALMVGDGADEFDTALAGIGQGEVSISPYQATLMTIGATVGAVPEPHLLVDDDREAGSIAPGASAAARKEIRAGMAACIASGTCTGLAGSGARWAKTGTAESGDRRNAWVVASSAERAVTVLVRGDDGERLTGAEVAVPVAAEVLSCCAGRGGDDASD